MDNRTLYPSLPQAWGIFGIYLAASIATGFAVGLINDFLNAKSLSPGNLAGYTLSMGFVVWFAWRNKTGRLDPGILHFKKIPGLLYPLLLILTLSLAVVLDPLTNLLPVPEFIEQLFAMLASKDIYTLLMVCILGPVLEEVLFRGIILEGFLHRYRPGKAIFWSAFLFGLFHMNPWQFIPGLIIGLLLGWIYLKTRSLIPVIVVHIINNSLSYFVMIVFGPDTMSFHDLFVISKDYIALVIIASAILIMCLLLLYRMLRPFQPFPSLRR